MFIHWAHYKSKFIILCVLSFAGYIAYYGTAFVDHLANHDLACSRIARELGGMFRTQQKLSELDMEDAIIFLIDEKEIKGEVSAELLPLDYAGNPYTIRIENSKIFVGVTPSFYFPFHMERDYDWQLDYLLEQYQ